MGPQVHVSLRPIRTIRGLVINNSARNMTASDPIVDSIYPSKGNETNDQVKSKSLRAGAAGEFVSRLPDNLSMAFVPDLQT